MPVTRSTVAIAAQTATKAVIRKSDAIETVLTAWNSIATVTLTCSSGAVLAANGCQWHASHFASRSKRSLPQMGQGFSVVSAFSISCDKGEATVFTILSSLPATEFSIRY